MQYVVSGCNFAIIFIYESFLFIFLFDLILYAPVNIFSVMSGHVFPGWTSYKQELMCLAQGHNTVTLVNLQPLGQAHYRWATVDPESILNKLLFIWLYTMFSDGWNAEIKGFKSSMFTTTGIDIRPTRAVATTHPLDGTIQCKANSTCVSSCLAISGNIYIPVDDVMWFITYWNDLMKKILWIRFSIKCETFMS